MGIFKTKEEAASLERESPLVAVSWRAAEAELARLQREHDDRRHDEALGYPAPDLARIADEMAAKRAEIAALQTRESEMAQKLDAERRSRLEREAVERLRSVPKLAADRMDLAERAWRQAHELGETLRALQANGQALAAACGSADAKRVFGLAALVHRIMHTLHACFDATPPDPERRAHRPIRFLPVEVGPADPLCKMTLPAAEQRTLDDVIRVYGSCGEALRARQRIDPAHGGERLHAVAEHGIWRLIEGHRRRPDAPAPADATPDDAA